ncbi:cyclin-dependent kinase-like 1 [Paramacrobiotus metropolitanus]|uniref:cyclin-dependent kinase-like 1 n=1 Tax=Paramacrobiotus metropolitanus TaxID=2943436 RepID=UPI002445BA76|nr:cyclin-dependent kinase-like 1 [Paramacrobiotus metropolitanus]
MERYEKLKKIGSGSYGYVYKCRNKETGMLVAIKKFLETEEDPTIQKITFREIRVLRDLNHPNIVNLVEVFRRRRKLHLVFEFCSSNLLDLMTSYPEGLPGLVARDILHQTLQALHYMHANMYVHRDVKPENILLQGKIVKLCDFGFARPINKAEATEFEKQSMPEMYTDYVATRWYRAPELLVGEPLYGSPVDVWASGCVFAECMTGEPLWPGTTDLDQLSLIRKTLGEVPLRYIGFFNKNPFFAGTELTPITEPETLESKVGHKIRKEAFEMLTSVLTKDATKRPTAEMVMKMPYFNGLPYMVPLEDIKQSKQKQMYAVFKAFAEQEAKYIMDAPDIRLLSPSMQNVHPSGSTSNPETVRAETKQRITKLLNGIAAKASPSKHALSGPLPPGIRELLKMRNGSAA